MSADHSATEFSANGDLFISPNGNDDWSGTHPEPTDDGTDGPLATIEGVKSAVRNRKHRAAFTGPLTVWLRGSRYEVDDPITFQPDDGGPITFAAYPGETPMIDGGVHIENWFVTQVNGTTAWVTDLPSVEAGE